MKRIIVIGSLLMLFRAEAASTEFRNDDIRTEGFSYNKQCDGDEKWKAPNYRANAGADEIFCGFTIVAHPRTGVITVDNATVEAYDISQSGVSFGGGCGNGTGKKGDLAVQPTARFIKRATILKGAAILSNSDWQTACRKVPWSVDHLKIDHLDNPTGMTNGCRPPIYYKNGQPTALCWTGP